MAHLPLVMFIYDLGREERVGASLQFASPSHIMSSILCIITSMICVRLCMLPLYRPVCVFVLFFFFWLLVEASQALGGIDRNQNESAFPLDAAFSGSILTPCLSESKFLSS